MFAQKITRTISPPREYRVFILSGGIIRERRGIENFPQSSIQYTSEGTYYGWQDNGDYSFTRLFSIAKLKKRVSLFSPRSSILRDFYLKFTLLVLNDDDLLFRDSYVIYVKWRIYVKDTGDLRVHCTWKTNVEVSIKRYRDGWFV